jgi:nicotinamide-nucleotide amidase
MIEEELVNLLIKKNLKISCAESCTGGLIASTIVNVPSASSVFECGIVTYSNEAKQKYLNISESDIKKYGVVSEEIASQMAEGIAKETHSDIGLSTTGFAGPSGGEDGKPIGTVCFGFYISGKVYKCTQIFKDLPRNEVRSRSVLFCFNKLIELLSL